MPRFVTFLSLFSVASFALPGTGNFIGEFLVLTGVSYRSIVMVVLAMGGIVLAAAYMLWMLQRVALGEPRTEAARKLSDINVKETAALVPLAILVFVIGLYPRPLLTAMDATVTQLVERIETRLGSSAE